MGKRITGSLLIATVLVLSGCSVAPWNQLNDAQRIELRDMSNGYQRGVLEDLVVSEAEYRQAVQDQWDCVESAGAVAAPIEENGGQLAFSFTAEGPDERALEKVTAAADACAFEFVDALGRVWVSQGSSLTE